MGDPAYDARRAAERAATEQREKADHLSAEVTLIFLEGVKDFFEGRAHLILEQTGQGSTRIAFCR